ncbi:MAG: tRNA guanosine(15) transglycosylase TgtA [Nitrososphaerales archaeon]
MFFEARQTDLAARIGRLSTGHGEIETPAFVPVVHPVRQAVSTDHLRRMGFDLLITNAYITRKRYGVEPESIHEIIKFDGSVMTDSGGYQVLRYGDVDVTARDMALFQARLGSDIAIPLDKPTGLKLSHEKAESYVNRTLEAAEETLSVVDSGGNSNSKTIWVGPVQGGEHLDLVSHSAKRLDALGFEMFALGSPTEVMESYEFGLLARMIIAAKSSLPSGKPLHLFGAGHPLTIPLAVALGCDTFDSASYMLYAREDRYLLPSGTAKLQDLRYLPCACEVCTGHTARELADLGSEERFVELAKHNLHAIKREVDSVKQAIVDGRLWEHVMQKAMSHPKLLEANEVLKEASAYLEDGTPLYKERALLLFTPVDQYRPELARFRRIVLQHRQNPKASRDTLLLLREPDEHPFYSSGIYSNIKQSLGNKSIHLAYYSPFLGVVPEELSDLFPAAHHVSSRGKFRADEFPTFLAALESYVSKNGFKRVIMVADEFAKDSLQRISEVTELVLLGKDATAEEIIEQACSRVEGRTK